MFGNSIDLSENVLSFLWERQAVTMNNIANNDTPGFRSSYTSFEDELRNKVRHASDRGSRKGVAQAIGSVHSQVKSTAPVLNRMDESNVDMDLEQVELVRTVFQYNYMANALNQDFTRLRAAIKGQ